MTSALSPSRERWLLLTIAGVQFTNIVDFMVMMPLGPQFTQLFAITDAQFGLLVSAYTFASGVSGLVGAGFIDRFDRKRALLMAYVLFALATLACGLASTYGGLMLARVAAGIFGGALTALTQTIVAELIPFERRGRAMGLVMTSFSLAAVAGVPLSLMLAARLSWHAPFFAIATVSLLLWIAAWRTLPALAGHLTASAVARPDGPVQSAHRSPASVYLAVLADANHRRAFAFSALTLFSGFMVIPYLTIYSQVNVGLRADEIPYLYLFGGLATIFTSRWIGRMADRHGKLRVFRRVAAVGALPTLAITTLPPVPLWVAVAVSACLFVAMNGRMVPGMAIVGAAAAPRLRGAFLSINGSVQSIAMGFAALVSGHIITRNPQGLVERYWVSALIGIAAIAAAAWLGGRLTVHDAGVSQVPGQKPLA